MLRTSKILFFCLSFLFLQVASALTTIKVATFDSGFGGFFTAKEIETVAQEIERTHDVSFEINHYGDTLNAPYGSRAPDDIARLSAKGIATAFDKGADHVFIACNTASTQFTAITQLLGKSHPAKNGKFISIIDASVRELRRQIDEQFKKRSFVTVAILATPATVKSGAYVRAIAESFAVKAPQYEVKTISQKRWLKPDGPEVTSASGELTLTLPEKKSLRIVLVGPANWVDMIENGASAEEKSSIIGRDLKLLASKGSWDIVAEFCTHFPAVEKTIKKEAGALDLLTKDSSFLAQGPLMASVFRKLIMPILPAGKKKTVTAVTRARIFISGENVEGTRTLAREVFPGEPVPEVSILKF